MIRSVEIQYVGPKKNFQGAGHRQIRTRRAALFRGARRTGHFALYATGALQNVRILASKRGTA